MAMESFVGISIITVSTKNLVIYLTVDIAECTLEPL